MLADLSKIIEQCKLAVSSLDSNSSVLVDKDVWGSIEKYYAENFKNVDASVVNDTLVTDNDGQKIFISAMELPKAKAVVPYYIALTHYSEVADKLAQAMGFSSRTTGDGKKFFRSVPTPNWKDEKNSTELDKYHKALTDVLTDESDRKLFELFLEDPVWSGIATDGAGSGKKLDRLDWRESGLLKVGGWVAAGATGRWRLVEALSSVSDLESGIKTESTSIKPELIIPGATRLTGGVNRVFYGAPGTGKSYKVNELTLAAGHEVVRTVFHPDVQNSEFVGALKPVMDDGAITYSFSPGSFAKALVAAVNNPGKHVALIIEELNRAPAAAVFGELFLLLDRNSDGSGEYDADFPSEEFMVWFQKKTGTTNTKMQLPSNLSIYATMNSADQGVYPLDTAFRRRWQQDYIEINYDTAPTGNIIIAKEAGVTIIVEWSKFIRVLNEHLAMLPYVEEDRLIGPWFVKSAEIKEDVNIPGKLLIYLWDDLLRHDGRDTVFATDQYSTYGALSSALVDNLPILSQELLAKLDSLVNSEKPDA